MSFSGYYGLALALGRSTCDTSSRIDYRRLHSQFVESTTYLSRIRLKSRGQLLIKSRSKGAMLREPFPPRSRATLISDSLVGDWWAICLDTLFGQLVNIISTHISPHHHNATWRTTRLFFAGPGAYAARARALPHPYPTSSHIGENAVGAHMERSECSANPHHTL